MSDNRTATKTNKKTAPRTFKDWNAARKVADQEPLGKPVWVETTPRDGDTPAVGHYLVRKLGPVAYAKRRAQLDAAERLRSDFGLVPGATVSTILRHKSGSGMFRRISLLVETKHGTRDVSRLAAMAMGDKEPRWNEDGIGVGGCGMDMGFHLVYNLGRTLYPYGFPCAGAGAKGSRGCPSNDHHNDPANKPRKGKLHKGDGGYALNQRWL